ncbi:MAG: hypothetical protein A2029_01435 [Chloroflexi bacterium RBG_19FT_COMBO_47_9]|nr:MAG: hypothetical protein A2W25_05025 [candidate division Zixibacteria bacterium RBG_16_53_22]OGO66569.1 MAG: hypothetical protein A2029_01435 [Chloroflexi bacterium RBG_19FT_COMBO_47_9]
MKIFGLLIFDDTYKLPERELIGEGEMAFERRTGTKASLALVNAFMEDLPVVEGLNVVKSYWLRRHQVIVGELISDQQSPESDEPRAKKFAKFA